MKESREEELRRKGWTRRFSASEPRLSESIEMYESLGFEVRLEPFHAEDNEECHECLEGFENTIRVIYTRPKKSADRG